MKMICLNTAFVLTAALGAAALPAQSPSAFSAAPYVPQSFIPYDAGARHVRISVASGLAALQKKDYASAQRFFVDAADGSLSPEIHFLAGIASAGNNNLKMAKVYLSRTVRMDRSHFDAHAALALVNVRMGDKAAALDVLAYLRARQKACDSECRSAKPLDQAVTSVERWVS